MFEHTFKHSKSLSQEDVNGTFRSTEPCLAASSSLPSEVGHLTEMDTSKAELGSPSLAAAGRVGNPTVCRVALPALKHPCRAQRPRWSLRRSKHQWKAKQLCPYVASSKDMVCGVCMEVVSEKANPSEHRFCMLSNWNHTYCLKCICKWRSAKQFDRKITESCLECHITSIIAISSEHASILMKDVGAAHLEGTVSKRMHTPMAKEKNHRDRKDHFWELIEERQNSSPLDDNEEEVVTFELGKMFLMFFAAGRDDELTDSEGPLLHPSPPAVSLKSGGRGCQDREVWTATETSRDPASKQQRQMQERAQTRSASSGTHTRSAGGGGDPREAIDSPSLWNIQQSKAEECVAQTVAQWPCWWRAIELNSDPSTPPRKTGKCRGVRNIESCPFPQQPPPQAIHWRLTGRQALRLSTPPREADVSQFPLSQQPPPPGLGLQTDRRAGARTRHPNKGGRGVPATTHPIGSSPGHCPGEWGALRP
ncbi:hypothetical protein ACTXT7_017350 [Hymenolepis weldensis]